MNGNKSQLTPFDFDSHPVRVVVQEGNPWFVAADVCAALELGNTTNALKRLDDDEQALISIKGLTAGNDQVNVINESGLYSLVLGSRKPEAKRFKKWVTSEVLPAIRKTGRYEASYTAHSGDTLTADEQTTLRTMIKARAETLPKDKRAGATIQLWSRLKSHFKCEYRKIPRSEFAEAVSIVARASLPGEPEALPGPRGLDEADLVNLSAICSRAKALSQVWHDELYPALRMMGSPLASRLFDQVGDLAFSAGLFRGKYGPQMEAAVRGLEASFARQQLALQSGHGRQLAA